MSKFLKAVVTSGRYSGETVRISNVSVDEAGRKNAACILTSGNRANIPVADLKVLEDEPQPEPPIRKAKTASMPFISGSTSSRSLTHTKNMNAPRIEKKSFSLISKETLSKCEKCGCEYNREARKGQPGKITECESCAEDFFKKN